jgi:putative sigma-54 modulation protein
MQLNVTFRHMDSSDFLRDYAKEKVERVNKYLDRAGDAHVVFSVERHLHQADITITSGRFVLRGHEKSEDMYASIDLAMDKIERQLRRYKERLKHHHGRDRVHHNEKTTQALLRARHNVVEIDSPEEYDEASEQSGEQSGEQSVQVAPNLAAATQAPAAAAPRVVSTSELDVRLMSVDEAAMQMDLMNSDFLVFHNAATHELNVLYRRKEDGKFGLIEAHVPKAP